VATTLCSAGQRGEHGVLNSSARPEVLYDSYLKNHLALEDIVYYMCGPGLMTKAVIAMLLDLGVDRDNILLDDFG
jgi:Na+-transporting NADH:ubiquinone oxidoreductase subunit NqrF